MLNLFHDLDRTLAEFDRLVDGRRMESRLGGAEPRLHIDETDAGWALTADLPGVAAEGVTLTVDDGLLRVSASRDVSAPEGARPLRRERVAWTLRRTIRLPEDVDPAAITARLVAGRLTVALPKRPAAEPRTIPVQSN